LVLKEKCEDYPQKAGSSLVIHLQWFCLKFSYECIEGFEETQAENQHQADVSRCPGLAHFLDLLQVSYSSLESFEMF